MTPSVAGVKVMVGSGAAVTGSRYPSCNAGGAPPMVRQPGPVVDYVFR